MRPLAFHADGIVPGDSPSFLDGAVVVDPLGRVLDVGPAATILPRHEGSRVVRVKGVIFPGLVNAHTHLELSALRGRVPRGGGFARWAGAMFEERSGVGEDESASAVSLALDELEDFATVAVGDVSNGLGTALPLAGRGMAGTVFHEFFGMAREPLLARIAELDSPSSPHLPHLRAFSSELRYAPAPHTLHTTHPDGVRVLVARARALGVTTSLHLAEHDAERRALEYGDGSMVSWLSLLSPAAARFPWPRTGPVVHARSLGLLAPDVLLVHLADARPEELDMIASAGAKVALCPRSNAWISGLVPPLASMLESGIEPALGTDSLASSPSLDVLEEAHALALAFPDLSCERLARMATWNGALALDLPHLGRIAPGARPGLFALEGGTPGSPAHALVHGRSLPRRPLVPRVTP